MNFSAFLRLFLAANICVSVLFYNANNFFEIKKTSLENSKVQEQKEENFFFFEEQKTPQSEPKEEKNQNTENSPPKEEQKPEQSLPTASEAVKGKVISRYISPYSAPLSYNKVYLKNSTSTPIDIKALLKAPLGFEIEKNNAPQVLILHTHATETFMQKDSDYYTENFSSRSIDNSKNMVRIGEIVAKKLNDAGIVTLHAKTQHDYPKYSGSYTRSAKTINEYLKKYPSIKVVLDLHRDAVSSGESDKVKLVTEIGGKKAAQVMLVMGSNTGSVTNFPNWKENLKLALRLQQTFEVKYPTLARPLSLASKNYNQSLSNGALLIEFGTDANALSEAEYSATLVGDCLVSLLKTI